MDQITEELMVPEKRAASWETFTKAESLYVQLRLAKEAEESKVFNKQQEIQRFKAHVKNEYARIHAEYLIALGKQITDAYTMALKDPDLTEDGLKKYMEIAAAVMSDIKPGVIYKFDYTLNSKE